MKNSTSRNLFRAALLALTACALPALAGPDTYGLGNGQDGPFSAGSNQIINRYTQLAAPAAVGDTTLLTTTSLSVGEGDLVMVFQMVGIVPEPLSGGPTPVDISNDPVGRWELARLGPGSGGTTLNLTEPLLYSYAAGVTQVIFVPEYTDVTISATRSIIAKSWDGNTGGIVAFLATGAILNSGSISATSRGFRGGQIVDDVSGSLGCTGLDEPAAAGAQKGEGIANSRYGVTHTGRGRVANAGGGGVCLKSGGGGGGNGGVGGQGGNSSLAEDGNRAVGGEGGAALAYSLVDHMTPGGGGGAGHNKDANIGQPGGTGGGIIFVRAASISGNGSIVANGAAAQSSGTDGASGGGAGGSIYLRFAGTADCGLIRAVGGTGGNTSTEVGPGGGGAGGRLLFQACDGACNPGTSSVAGALSGTQPNTGAPGGASYGAQPGAGGVFVRIPGCYAPPGTPLVVTPANGSMINDDTPTYTGTLPVPFSVGTEVVIYVDGVEVGRVAPEDTGNWAFTQLIGLAQGAHTVNARAVNTAEGTQSGLSNTNTFTIDSVPPAAPVVKAPAHESTTGDTTPTYTGTAEPGSTVTVIVDGSPVGTTTADVSGDWSLVQPIALPDGPHTVNATAMDAAGNTSPSSNTNTFTVDTTPPAAPVVLTPTDGASTNDTTPTYTGTAEPGSIVTVFVDGVVAGDATADAAGNWSFTQPAVLVDGAHTVKATAMDALGNTSPESNTNTFTVDTVTPAAPVVLTPVDGSIIGDSTPTYTGTAESGSTVTVIVDGTAVGTATTDATGSWSFTPVVPLADGPHSVRATATDAAGNTSLSSNTNAFTVDTTAPAAPVVFTPADGSTIGESTPTYTGTAEPGSTITVLVDNAVVGTTVADAAGTWSLTQPAALADGAHTVKATATDAQGNTSPESNTNTFTVDTTAPAAPVVLTPADGASTNDTTPTYTGTAEPGSTVTVLVDGTAVGTTTADAAGDWSLTQPAALADGVHTVKATAMDALGNTSSESNTNTFTVDTVAPAAPVVLTPVDGSIIGDSTPTYTGTAESGSTVTVIVDGTAVGTATTDATGSWSFMPVVPLADGPHNVRATATDAAGNTSLSSNTNAFTVDTMVPVAPVVLTPANGSSTSDNTPAYTGTAEPGSTVTVIVDGVVVGTTTADVAGNWSLMQPTALADGPHSVRATAMDAAGNTSPSSNTNAFTVDTTAPVAPVVLTPADGSTIGDSTPAYTGTAEPGSTVTVLVDNAVVGTTLADAAGSWSLTQPTALADGAHTVKATATDAVGNTSPESNTNTFTVDTTAPAAPVVLTPLDGSTIGDSTPTYTGTAEPGSTVTVIVDNTVLGTTTADVAGNWSLTQPAALADGVHTVKATATDAVGNTSPESNTNTFTVDTTAPAAPVVLTPADGSTIGDSTPTYTGTAEPGSTVTVLVDNTVVGTTTADVAGNWSLTQPAALADGAHTVKATATDAQGNTSPESNTNTFTVDTTAPAAPVVLTPADGSSTSDNTPAYTGTAEPGSTVTILVDNAVVGTTMADATGSWSFIQPAALADGTHTVKATATDAVGNTSPESNTNTFTVDTTAPAAPVVLTPLDGSTIGDSTPTYTGTAEPGSTVTVIVDNTVLGTTTADAAGSWSLTQPAALADGTHTVKATATDAVGNTSPESNTNTFTVDTTAPAAPVVLTPADGSSTSDNTPAYTGTAEPGSTVTVIVDGSVAGTTTADAAGGWSLTQPTALADGTHTVKATATDAVGNTSPESNTNTFTVDTTAPAAPVVLTPLDGSTIGDSTPTYSGTAEPGSTVTVIVDNTVLGTTTADAAGSWNFIQPAALADGVHTVKATATDAVGNTSPESNTNTFTVDTTLPVAPVVVAPANGSTIGDNTPAYTGTAEPGSTVTVIVDGTAVGTTTADAAGNWTFTQPTALADGAHTVKITATDTTGNTSPESNTNTFTVDTTAPAAPVVLTPLDGSTIGDSTPTYTGTAEPGSTVTVLVDNAVVGSTTADAAGNWSFTQPTALADGAHTVKATATDAVGNTSPESNTHTFTVDATAPAAPVVLTPANGSTTSDNTPAYTGTAEPGSTVTILVDNAVVGTTTADAAGNWSLTQPTALADGTHTVKATATDAVGNTSPESNTNTFTVDTTAPAAPVVLTPLDGSTIGDSTPTYTGTAEPGSTVTVLVDGTAVGTTTADAAGTWSLTQPTGLPNGPHTVKATATDAVGNTSPESNTNTFIVDAMPPDVPVVLTPANGSITNDNTPAISGTAEPEVTVNVFLGTTLLGTTTADAAGNWTFTPTTPLADGTYDVSATASDSSGNTSAPSNTNTFTVDATAPAAPVVTGPAHDSVTTDTTPALTGTAEPGISVTVSLNGNVVGTITSDAAGNWTLTPSSPLPDGPYTLVATASDPVGNTSPPSNTVRFVIDTTPPETTIVSGPSGDTTKRNPTFEFGSNEAGVTYECSLDGEAFAACSNPSSFEDLALGEHTLQVRARDSVGNVDATPASVTWNILQADRAFLGGGIGCAATGGQPSALAMMGLAVLSALLARRRQR